MYSSGAEYFRASGVWKRKLDELAIGGKFDLKFYSLAEYSFKFPGNTFDLDYRQGSS